MRTTVEIDIPDALVERAQAVGRQHHVTLNELVAEGLRKEVYRVAALRTQPRLPVRSMSGAELTASPPTS
ncbi:DUF2191 domain-containing protein [Luteipulveratus mongoliensis]|uniref:Uncharacterized protein n=1 Tax=Luteipulveratus mongoliensis TaxID=571913 RepID=A0A0K1JEX5_9MICO|nr:DUF2191 domain-containing protein [Luteipulveratus mongoliensis]AKU15155.1 hypothetical protein VV02_03550 [Luteipulveratus mongoliensis]